jgi:hypothetical protein
MYACYNAEQLSLWTVEFNEYIEQSKKINKNIFYVNSICEGRDYLAYGGAFAIVNNELKAFLGQKKEDVLVVTHLTQSSKKFAKIAQF